MKNSAFNDLLGTWELSTHEEKFMITYKGDKSFHSEYIIKEDGSITKTNGVFEIVDVGANDMLRLLVLYNPTDKIKTVYEVIEITESRLRLTIDEEEDIITLRRI